MERISDSAQLVLRIGAAAVGVAAGLAFPDLDIALFGIGGHRNAFFHSALAPYAATYVAGLAQRRPLLGRPAAGLAAGFALGVGLHLLVDGTLQSGKAVLFPIIGSLVDGTLFDDKAWLLANSAGCFYLGGSSARQAFPDLYEKARYWWEGLRGHVRPRSDEGEDRSGNGAILPLDLRLRFVPTMQTRGD